MAKAWLLLGVFIALMPTAAGAHSWYPSDCCKDEHCHPAPCDEIKKDGTGFVWFDAESRHKIFFTRDQMKSSQDDGCHVCVQGWTGVCIFLPWRS